MAKHTLKAQPRSLVGHKVKQLRRTGSIPANVFGKDTPSASIQVAQKALESLVKEAGESALVYLQVEGEKAERPAMVAELHRDPVTGAFLHAAFKQVSLKEKTTTAVGVKLIGEAPAEAEKKGILVQQLHEVEVEALPADMPENLEVDVSSLAEVDAAIYVKDIKVDDKLTLKSDPEAIVVAIEPLAAEEVVEKPVEEAPAPVEGEAPAATGEGEPTPQAPASSDQSP